METSVEKTRSCWLIIQRLYLLSIWGCCKIYVFEMEFFRLWVGQRHWLLCKQMWRICALILTLNSLFSLGIFHITWPTVSYMKTNMAAMRIETQTP